jgi:hypothetical protein
VQKTDPTGSITNHIVGWKLRLIQRLPIICALGTVGENFVSLLVLGREGLIIGYRLFFFLNRKEKRFMSELHGRKQQLVKPKYPVLVS